MKEKENEGISQEERTERFHPDRAHDRHCDHRSLGGHCGAQLSQGPPYCSKEHLRCESAAH